MATILSAGMLLDWLSEKHQDTRCAQAAAALRAAVAEVLRDGPRTADIGGTAGTAEVTDAVVDALVAVAA